MDLKSSRFVVCLIGLALTQWSLVARLIDSQTWLIVVTVCLGGFGVTKTVEYAKSGRKPDAPVPCNPEPPELPPTP